MRKLVMGLDKRSCFYIGGEWVQPSGKQQIVVTNPTTEEAGPRYPEAEAADIDRAVAAARGAFDNGPWPRLLPTERAAMLAKIGDALIARIDELASLWTTEVGALQSFGQASIPGVAGLFHYYASLGATFPFEERHVPSAGGKVGLLVREPVGVVGAIIPWNGPLLILALKVAPALLAGCTIVIKSSPEAPGAAYVFAEIVESLGLPPGVVNVLTADREVSELLVRHPGVDKISFTGSTAAGRQIASICGGRLARCTLELGGKSAAVVLDDYDVDLVADALLVPATMMTGQVCAALTRIVVPRRRHDAFVDAMASRFAAVRTGDPMAPGTGMGPLASRRQRDKVETYIARGQSEGAVLATGGRRPAHLNRGFFIEPTIFSQVDNASAIAREEIFGPVLSVIPSDSDEQSIAIANDSPFGLNASVFTNDIDRAYHATRQLRAGTVGHNAFRTDFTISFGGFKQSGIGREGGVEGLLPYLESKAVILEETPSHIA